MNEARDGFERCLHDTAKAAGLPVKYSSLGYARWDTGQPDSGSVYITSAQGEDDPDTFDVSAPPGRTWATGASYRCRGVSHLDDAWATLLPAGSVVTTTLTHVRGAVLVGDRWTPLDHVEGWNDGLGRDDDGTEVPGVFVRLRNIKARFIAGITAENFARRYGAAMGEP